MSGNRISPLIAAFCTGWKPLLREGPTRPKEALRIFAASWLFAAVALAGPELVISEIQLNPRSPEDGEKQTEWVEIYNAGEEKVNLEGLQLTSGTRSHPHEPKQRHVLGALQLKPGEFLLIGIGSATSYDGLGLPEMASFCDEKEYAWLINSGDAVALRDAAGQVIDEVTYGVEDPWPAKGPGASLQFIGLDAEDPAAANDDPKNWIGSDEQNAEQFPGHGYGTPGAPPKSATTQRAD